MHPAVLVAGLRRAHAGVCGGVAQEATAKIDEYARGMISGSGSTLFEELGLYYIGPIDGHNLDLLIAMLQGARARMRASIGFPGRVSARAGPSPQTLLVNLLLGGPSSPSCCACLPGRKRSGPESSVPLPAAIRIGGGLMLSVRLSSGARCMPCAGNPIRSSLPAPLGWPPSHPGEADSPTIRREPG